MAFAAIVANSRSYGNDTILDYSDNNTPELSKDDRHKEHHDNDIHRTVNLDDVVVSANKSVVKRKDAPVVVNVISARLLEQVNAPDLAKTLSYQSGLRVENNCQNCGFPQVRINGLDGPYSQILICISGCTDNTVTVPASVDLSGADYYMYDPECGFTNASKYPPPPASIPVDP